MSLEEKPRSDLISLHYLRALAVVLITYDHLIPGMFLETTGTIPVTFVERYVLWPFSIIHYFGFYGVVIFFLLSGYLGLYSHSRKPSGAGSFLLKRLFRILPPVLGSAAAYYVLCGLARLFPVGGSAFPGSYLRVNAALWTLDIEVLFYLLFALLIPLFRRNAAIATAAATAITAGLCEVCIRVPALARYGDVCSYLFYVLAGCEVFLLRETDPARDRAYGRILRWLLVPALWYCIIHYNIVVFNPERYEQGNSYGVSAVYALLTFLVFLSNERRLPESRLVRQISRHSYSVYLDQVPMRALFATLSGTVPTLGLSGMAIAFTVLLSWSYERYVSGLWDRLYQKITAGSRRGKSA